MSLLVNDVPPHGYTFKVVCVQDDLAFLFAKFWQLGGPDNTQSKVKYSSQGYAVSHGHTHLRDQIHFNLVPGILDLCLSFMEA